MANVIEQFYIALDLKNDKILDKLNDVEKKLDSTKKATKETNKVMKSGADATVSAYRSIRNEILLIGSALVGISSIKSFLTGTISEVSKLGYVAKTLGMTTQKLEQFQLAAEKSGSSKDSITNFLGSINEGIAQLYSQGSGMFTEGGGPLSFIGLGGNRGNIKKGDIQSGVLEMSRVLQNAYSKGSDYGAEFAKNAGIPSDLVPMLLKGKEGVLALLKAQEKYTNISAEDAKKFQDLDIALKNLSNNFNSTARNIEAYLLPVLTEIVGQFEKLGDWIKSHDKDIAKVINGWTKEVLGFIHAFFGENDEQSKRLDAWKTKLDAIADAFLKIGKVAGVISDTIDFFMPDEYEPNKPGRTRKESSGLYPVAEGAIGKIAAPDTAIKPGELSESKKIVDFFVSKGWTREQAAGLAANAFGESSFNTRAYNKDGGGRGARGLFQWRGKRLKEFEKMFGKDMINGSLIEQLSFADWELKTEGQEAKAGYMLRNAHSAKDAGRIISAAYERHENLAEDAKRGYLARKIFADTYDNVGKFTGKQQANSTPTQNFNISGDLNVNANNAKQVADQVALNSQKATGFNQQQRGMR